MNTFAQGQLEWSGVAHRRGVRASAAASISLVFAVALSPGCKREEVTHVQTSSSPQAQPSPGAPMQAPQGAPMMQPPTGAPGQAPPGMAGDVAPPPRPANAIQWTLPKGWTEAMTGGMRYATLTPPVKGHVDVSVVVLPGPAGGELANVNRWRGQLGLGPIGDAELASSRKPVKSKAGPVSLYDFTGEGEKKSRMMAGLAVFDGSSWFVKMVGDADAVAAAQKDFVHILESLHFAAQ
jgi:hypothetical protein